MRLVVIVPALQKDWITSAEKPVRFQGFHMAIAKAHRPTPSMAIFQRVDTRVLVGHAR